jgi:hypothetical protein
MRSTICAAMLALATTTADGPAHACGGLLRDLIDPNCRPPLPMVWSKPRASQAEFAQSRYRCLQESQQSTTTAVAGVGGVSTVVTNDQLFTACMNARGWVLTPAR